MVDPRVIELAEEAEVHLQIKAGGTNIALLNGLMNVIINKGWHDQKYVENRTEGFEELKEIVQRYTPEKSRTSAA